MRPIRTAIREKSRPNFERWIKPNVASSAFRSYYEKELIPRLCMACCHTPVIVERYKYPSPRACVRVITWGPMRKLDDSSYTRKRPSRSSLSDQTPE